METQAQKEILEWFGGRAGDHFIGSDYERLYVELANLLSVLGTGAEEFKSIDDINEFLYKK